MPNEKKQTAASRREKNLPPKMRENYEASRITGDARDKGIKVKRSKGLGGDVYSSEGADPKLVDALSGALDSATADADKGKSRKSRYMGSMKMLHR